MNTCIVCGQAAGSGEHVFPAALGGRRTNKNIYCTTHDNGYSSLVADLANQVDVLNAQLGVVPDHSNDVKSVLARDPHPGGHPNSPTHGHLKFPHPDRASMRR